MNKDINQFIEKGYCIVASTQGLARHMQNIYAAQQIEAGMQSWPSVNIVSWNVWCKQLWLDLLSSHRDLPILLNQHQSLALWQEQIQNSRYAKVIFQAQATARQAHAAYKLYKHWQIDEQEKDIYLNEDAFAFKHWKESYELRLKSNDWVDEAGLANYLMEQIDHINTTTSQIAFYGFDQFVPQQLALIKVFDNASGEVQIVEPFEQNEQHVLQSFQDSQSEMQAAADYAIACLKKDPKIRIGIVVPNLRKLREQIIHEFEKKLSLENFLDFGFERASSFTISIGKPLSAYPAIATAFQLLSLLNYKIPANTISLLLRSPFIKGYEKESSNRSLFDATLRNTSELKFTISSIIRLHEQLEAEKQCPEFINAIQEFIKLQKESKLEKTPGQWINTINDLLACFGWPGERHLSSDEYQTLETWQACYDTLSGLDSMIRKCSLQSTISILRRIANDTSFQPQTVDAPIQIIGLEGVSGMRFDELWMMGLHDQVWPEQSQPNPFIPIKLQREFGITNSSPESRLETAKLLTRNIVRSAKNVVLSSPLKEGDRELRASPVLQEYRSDKEMIIQTNDDFYQSLIKDKNIETITDVNAPAIKSGETISGGTSIFKDIAACPFRSVAKHCLHAEGLNRSDIGLSASERGNLVHRVMQLFWQSMKHSEHLRRISETVLHERIYEAIDKAIASQSKYFPETFSKRFTEIERQRLFKLMNTWLLIERDRESFTVKATEKGHHVIFNGITLHMRIDRIDELADGRLVIIDYKTGKVTVNAWSGERPDDPQLPLYRVTSEGDIAALVFAKIRAGECAYVGVSEEEGLLPGVKTHKEITWEEQREEWEGVLKNLARDFLAGKAIVDPKPYACQYCDLESFCRIDEKTENVLEHWD